MTGLCDFGLWWIRRAYDVCDVWAPFVVAIFNVSSTVNSSDELLLSSDELGSSSSHHETGIVSDLSQVDMDG